MFDIGWSFEEVVIGLLWKLAWAVAQENCSMAQYESPYCLWVANYLKWIQFQSMCSFQKYSELWPYLTGVDVFPLTSRPISRNGHMTTSQGITIKLGFLIFGSKPGPGILFLEQGADYLNSGNSGFRSMYPTGDIG